jgi:hypothetical protein
MERDRVRKERQKRFMAMRKMQRVRGDREILYRLMVKRINSKNIQRVRSERQNILMANRIKSKVMPKRSSVSHLRNEKRIMMAKKAIER